MSGYVIASLIGLVVGLISGAVLYAKVLDKPEVSNNYQGDVRIRQKKGNFKNFIDRLKR